MNKNILKNSLISLSYHCWIIYDGTRTPIPNFLSVETLKTFFFLPFSTLKYFSHFSSLSEKVVCAGEKQRNRAFWFSVFQRTIYRNLFLLPFTFHPNPPLVFSSKSKHKTQTPILVVSSLTQTTTISPLSPPRPTQKHFVDFSLHTLYNHPISSCHPLLKFPLFRLCWFFGG